MALRALPRRGQRVGIVHGRRRFPRPAHPDAQAAGYMRRLGPYLTSMRAEVMRALEHAARVEGLIADATGPDPAKATGEIARRALREAAQRIRERWSTAALSRTVAPVASAVDAVSRANVARVLSVPVAEVPGGAAETLGAWTQSNAKLITTVAERYLAEVGSEVEASYREGARWEDLSRTLEERYGVARSNAERIARTETAKLSGELTRSRFEAAGVTRGVWRTSRDERVRDSHAELEGEEYVLTQGLGGIWPGSEPNCRCWSDPVLED